MDHPILDNPKAAVEDLVEDLEEQYESVNLQDYGNGWFNITIKTLNELVVHLTFYIHHKWCSRFQNEQIYAELSADVVGKTCHPISAQQDQRLGSDPDNLDYLRLKVEEYLRMARSPKIVVEDKATITNKHGYTHQEEQKHLVNSTMEAEDIEPFWEDTPDDSTVESSERNLRPMNQWEEEVYHA